MFAVVFGGDWAIATAGLGVSCGREERARSVLVIAYLGLCVWTR
jgi:hypothetical protein